MLMCLIRVLDYYHKYTLLNYVSLRISFPTKIAYFQFMNVHISLLHFFGRKGMYSQ